MPDLNLSFGIEIECIVCFDPAGYETVLPHADGWLWDEKISSVLQHETKLRILFRSYIAKYLNEKGYATYEVTSPGGDQKWTVTNDASIQINDGPRAEDGFLECDIEIKSPAMHFCPKALDRVLRVVRELTRHFDATLNDSCGLHVYIGNCKKGFPLETLKRFCMLAAMFEPQLNTLHPAHRIGNYHAKGPSAVFKGQNPWDTLREIQRCESTAELVVLFADFERVPDSCFAYNLCPMVFGRRKTIEFRQHMGTLEGPEIMKWIQLVGGMVDVVHTISPVGLAQLINTGAFDPRFTIIDLLLRLKLEGLVPFYQGRLHVHPRPEPIWVRGKAKENAEVVPRRRHALERWEEMERRHRFERFEDLNRRQELDRRHELERRRELERQDDEVDSPRETSE